MLTEFVSLQLSREELQEIHAALVQRAILEEELRREQGQEPVDRHPLLEKFEALLGESDERLHRLDHQLEDDLWEYAWFVFTDEWARNRAKHDVLKELGVAAEALPSADIDRRVDAKYQQQFETYVSELSLKDQGITPNDSPR